MKIQVLSLVNTIGDNQFFVDTTEINLVDSNKIGGMYKYV